MIVSLKEGNPNNSGRIIHGQIFFLCVTIDHYQHMSGMTRKIYFRKFASVQTGNFIRFEICLDGSSTCQNAFELSLKLNSASALYELHIRDNYR